MTPRRRTFLLSEIERLKREKPDKWKSDVKWICRELADDEGITERERTVDRHEEMIGRKSLPIVSPPW